jgi:hypothetical protein
MTQKLERQEPELTMDTSFDQIRSTIRPEDLQVDMSMALVVNANMGSLLWLKAEVRRLFGANLIYPTMSKQNIYVVHWNDLSEKKQKELTKH